MAKKFKYIPISYYFRLKEDITNHKTPNIELFLEPFKMDE